MNIKKESSLIFRTGGSSWHLASHGNWSGFKN